MVELGSRAQVVKGCNIAFEYNELTQRRAASDAVYTSPNEKIFDIFCGVDQTPEAAVAWIEYDSNTFTDDGLRLMMAEWIAAWAKIRDQADGKMKEECAVAWNQTKVALDSSPRPLTAQDAFMAAVELHGCAIALIGDGCGSEGITYGELALRCGRLAKSISPLKRAASETIGLIFERSITMIVAVFGVLSSSSAYLPLQPEAPVSRSSMMLQQSSCGLCLVQHAEMGQVIEQSCEVITAVATAQGELLIPSTNAPAMRSALAHDAVLADPNPATSGDLVYVMFTSGSTGRPKGVQVEHGWLGARTKQNSCVHCTEPGVYMCVCGCRSTADPHCVASGGVWRRCR